MAVMVVTVVIVVEEEEVEEVEEVMVEVSPTTGNRQKAKTKERATSQIDESARGGRKGRRVSGFCPVD